jgi:ribulose-phosphate 3-epimerase
MGDWYNHIKISPSLLAADFGNLADEVRRVEDAGADTLHLDVMDGHFVDNISFGPKVVAACNRASDMFLDVHLMIYNPFAYIEKFIEAGADQITFHIEATEDVDDSLAYIRRCGKRAGLAICPDTSETMLLKYLDKCDQILLMTVNPGFGGQPFMPEVLRKIEFLRSTIDRIGIREGGQDTDPNEDLAPFDIQVDGGINLETAQQCVDAGANVLVAGTHLFDAPDMEVAVAEMREILSKNPKS